MVEEDVKEDVEELSWIFSKRFVTNLYMLIAFIGAPYFLFMEIFRNIALWLAIRKVKKVLRKNGIDLDEKLKEIEDEKNC
jgi:hypothetical protein